MILSSNTPSKNRETYLESAKLRALSELTYSENPSTAFFTFVEELSNFQGSEPIYDVRQWDQILPLTLGFLNTPAQMRQFISNCH